MKPQQKFSFQKNKTLQIGSTNFSLVTDDSPSNKNPLKQYLGNTSNFQKKEDQSQNESPQTLRIETPEENYKLSLLKSQHHPQNRQNSLQQNDLQMLLLNQMRQHDQYVAKQQQLFEEQIKNQQQVILLLKTQLEKANKEDNSSIQELEQESQRTETSTHKHSSCNKEPQFIQSQKPLLKAYKILQTKNEVNKNPNSKNLKSLHQINESHKTYLDKRHQETVQKINYLRLKQLSDERAQLKPLFIQTLNNSNISSRKQSSSRQNQSYHRQIEKNVRIFLCLIFLQNEKSLSKKRETIMKQDGISFTPKLHKKSQSLERSVDDLILWKKVQDQKIHKKQEQKHVQFQTMIATQKICPGSFKILGNKTQSRDRASIERYQQCQNNEKSQTLQKNVKFNQSNQLQLSSQKIKEAKIKLQITPKAKMSQPLIFKETNKVVNLRQKKINLIPKQTVNKSKPTNQDLEKQKESKIRDKLNLFIRQKYQQSDQKQKEDQKQVFIENTNLSPKIRSTVHCSPDFETDISLNRLNSIHASQCKTQEQEKKDLYQIVSQKFQKQQQTALLSNNSQKEEANQNNFNSEAKENLEDQSQFNKLLGLTSPYGYTPTYTQTPNNFEKVQNPSQINLNQSFNQVNPLLSCQQVPLQMESQRQSMQRISFEHQNQQSMIAPFYHHGRFHSQHQFQPPQLISPQGIQHFPIYPSPQIHNHQFAHHLQLPNLNSIPPQLNQQLILQQIEIIKQNIMKNQQIENELSKVQINSYQVTQDKSMNNVEGRSTGCGSNQSQDGNHIQGVEGRMESKASLFDEEELFKLSIDEQQIIQNSSNQDNKSK